MPMRLKKILQRQSASWKSSLPVEVDLLVIAFKTDTAWSFDCRNRREVNSQRGHAYLEPQLSSSKHPTSSYSGNVGSWRHWIQKTYGQLQQFWTHLSRIRIGSLNTQ